jgi:hypothetical protein
MPTTATATAASTSVWLGDPNYGTTTADIGAYTLTGDFDSIGTTTNSGCITLGGSIGTNYNNRYYIPPKNGDIEIDGNTLKARIYDSDLNKWIDCNIETMKNKDGETTLEVSYNFSAKEEKELRGKREVLFEKIKKVTPITINTSGFINLADNIYHLVQPNLYGIVDNRLYGNNGIWDNNLVVGGAGTAPILATATPATAVGVTINGPLNVNGTITVTNTDSISATNLPVGTMWHDGTNLRMQTNTGTHTLALA